MSECLRIRSLDKHFNGVKALDACSLSVRQGEVVGLIGPNGAGKTTLFNVATGFIRPDNGFVSFHGIDLLKLPTHEIAMAGISRTFQDLRLIRGMSALDNVCLAFKNQPGEQLSNLLFRNRRCSEGETLNRKSATVLLTDIGLGHDLHIPADNLSYGQQKLLSLVCCLAADADLLLLDEPVAGIAPETREQLLRIIESLPGRGKSVVLIEHNMDAVAKVCSRVVFMDFGAVVCDGTMDEVRNDPRVIEAYLR